MSSQKRFRNWATYVRKPQPKRALRETEASYFIECFNNEGVFPRDLTKPGMVMSIKEIIDHHQSGRPIPTTQGYFHDQELEPYMPEFNKMTKLEQLDFMRANRERVESYYYEKQKAEKLAAKKQADEKEAEYNRLKEFESSVKANARTDSNKE